MRTATAVSAETAAAAGEPGQTVQLAAGGQAVTAGPGGTYQTVTLVPSDGNSDEVSYVLIVQVSRRDGRLPTCGTYAWSIAVQCAHKDINRGSFRV